VTAAERRAQRLLRSYPRGWRDRYGDEFVALLSDGDQAAARQIDNTGGNDVATLLVACVNLQTMPASSKALDMA